MKISFQDGVSTLYNKCVSCGSTPSNKTPTAISQSIEDIYNTRYNEGYEDGNDSGSSGSMVGTAVASDVLSGKTFTNSTSVGISGTMKNNGTLNWSDENTTKTITPGYYSGGTLDSRPSYNAGHDAGYTEGKNDGYNEGHDAGYEEGYNEPRSFKEKSVNVSNSYSTGSNNYAAIFNSGITGKVLWSTMFVAVRSHLGHGGGSETCMGSVSYNSQNGQITVNGWYSEAESISVWYME